MKRLLLFVLLLVPAGARAEVPTDTSPRAPRTVSETVLEAARAERQFTYEEPAKAPAGPGLWAMLQRLVNDLLRAATHPAGRPIQYGLLGLLVLWLVVRIARMEPSAALRRAAVQVRGPGMPEELTARDYLGEARRARSEGEARLAVRFLFLHTLRLLADAGRIAYRPEKTNRVYLREVGVKLRPALLPIVRGFESAWYGGAMPSGEEYDMLEGKMTALAAELKGADAR